MTDRKLLQAIIDSLAVLRGEITQRFNKVDERFDRLEKRIDKIGSTVAYLEDDTPTTEAFDKLGKRVTKLEKRVATN